MRNCIEIYTELLAIIRRWLPCMNQDNDYFRDDLAEYIEKLRMENQPEALIVKLEQFTKSSFYFSESTNNFKHFSNLIITIKFEYGSIEANKALDEVGQNQYRDEALTENGFTSTEELKCYLRLRPYVFLAKLLEDNDQSFAYAYKLTVIFGDFDKTIQYLKEFNSKYPDNYKLLHDACLFNISGGKWDLKIWRALASKYLVEATFRKAIGFASKIEQLHLAIQDMAEDKMPTNPEKNAASKELTVVAEPAFVVEPLVPVGVAIPVIPSDDSEADTEYSETDTENNGGAVVVATAADTSIVPTPKTMQARANEFIEQLFKKTFAKSKEKNVQVLKEKFERIKSDLDKYKGLALDSSEMRKKYIEDGLQKRKKEIQKQMEYLKGLELKKDEIDDAETKKDPVSQMTEGGQAAVSVETVEILKGDAPLSLAQQKTQHKLEELTNELATIETSKLAEKLDKEFDEYNKALQNEPEEGKAKELYIKMYGDRVEKGITGIKKNLVKNYCKSLDTFTPDLLIGMALFIGYDRAEECIEAKDILLPLGVPEAAFDKFLELEHNKLPKNSDPLLPKIFVNGAYFGYPNFFLVKLDDDDIKGPFLGYPTGCCQSIGADAESSAVYGYTKENSCFYVLCRGTPPEHYVSSKKIDIHNIIAVTWAWRSFEPDKQQYSDIVVFDNIEANPAESATEEKKNIIRRFFTIAAVQIVKCDLTISQVNCGTRYGVRISGEEVKLPQKLVDKNGPVSVKKMYSDAAEQTVMYNNQEPILGDIIIKTKGAIEKLNDPSVKLKVPYNQIIKQVLTFADAEDLVKFLGLYPQFHIKNFLQDTQQSLTSYLMKVGNFEGLKGIFNHPLYKNFIYERNPKGETCFSYAADIAIKERKCTIFNLMLESPAISTELLLAEISYDGTIAQKAFYAKNRQLLIKIIQHPCCSSRLLRFAIKIKQIYNGENCVNNLLLYAGLKSDTELSEIILTSTGCDAALLEERDYDDNTPLLNAVSRRNHVLINQLLENKYMTADIFAMRNSKGKSVVELAIATIDQEIINLIVRSKYLAPNLLKGTFFLTVDGTAVRASNLLFLVVAANQVSMFDYLQKTLSPEIFKELCLERCSVGENVNQCGILELALEFKCIELYGKILSIYTKDTDPLDEMFLINGKNKEYGTVLHLALKEKNNDFFFTCVKDPKMTKAVFNKTSKYSTILWCAIEQGEPGSTKLIDSILESAFFSAIQLTARDENYDTPLLWAVKNKVVDITIKFLNNKYMNKDIFAMRNINGKSVVELAMANFEPTIVTAILSSSHLTEGLLDGIYPNSPRVNNLLPAALVEGDDVFFKLMLNLQPEKCSEKSFRSLYTDKDGIQYTILGLARKQEKFAFYPEILNNSRVDENILSRLSTSGSIFFDAVQDNQPGDEELIQAIIGSKIFRKSQLLTRYKDDTPLLCVVKNKKQIFISQLVEHAYMDENIFSMCDANGKSVVELAMATGDVKVAELILSSKHLSVNLLRVRYKGDTPLLWTVKQKNQDLIAKLIVHEGMNEEIFAMRDMDGSSIVDIAIDYMEPKIIELVLKSKHLSSGLLQGSFGCVLKQTSITNADNLLLYAAVIDNKWLFNLLLQTKACTIALITAVLEVKDKFKLNSGICAILQEELSKQRLKLQPPDPSASMLLGFENHKKGSANEVIAAETVAYPRSVGTLTAF